MLVAIQVLNTALIFVAGVLLATRIYPSLMESIHITGHDYIKDLEAISRELSEKEFENSDTELLKTKSVHAISLIAESLVDSKMMAIDTRSRTRVGLILLAAGTFIQSLLFIVTG